jgi:hypothetical protein
VVQLAQQPGAARNPVAIRGGFGDTQRLGRFINGQTGKEAQFDDLALTGIQSRQVVKRVVQRHQFEAALPWNVDAFIQRQHRRAAPAFIALLRPGMVYQDAAHHLTADGEEVGAILPLGLLLIHQAKPRFVDQGRALQGVVAALTAKMAVSQPAQLGVDQRRELVDGGLITRGPLSQQCGDVGRSHDDRLEQFATERRAGKPPRDPSVKVHVHCGARTFACCVHNHVNVSEAGELRPPPNAELPKSVGTTANTARMSTCATPPLVI